MSRQLDDALCDLFLGLAGSAGERFNRPATAVTSCEIHPGKDTGRIVAQYLLNEAELLEDLPPVKQGKQAQTGEGIAAGQLLPGLPVLFAQREVVQGGFERALKPVPDRRQGSRFVVQQVDQLCAEIRAGTRFRFCKFRQEREKLVGITAIGSDQPVRPVVGQLTFAQISQCGDGLTLDAFDKRDAQHLGNCPEFADSQRARRLVGLDKSQDILPVQAQFRMRYKILGETVNVRQAPVWIRSQCGQLPVKTSWQIQQDIAGISLQDVLVIKYPIGGQRCFLFQAARRSEIRADLTGPFP